MADPIQQESADRRPRLRCPACGWVMTGPDQFQIVLPYKAAGIGFVEGYTPDGDLAVEWGDRGDPFKFFTPELVCVDCGHQWQTARGWSAAQNDAATDPRIRHGNAPC